MRKKYAELGDTTVDALLSEDSEVYEKAGDKKNIQGYNRGSVNSESGEPMSISQKDRLIQLLEKENAEFKARVEKLEGGESTSKQVG